MTHDRSISRRTKGILIALALGLVVVACYWPVGRLGFVNFDDPLYVTQNVHVQGGLTAESLLWAFRDMGSSNWHPLTWLSHMLDWSLFGADARGHHLMNLCLHGINTMLLFHVLTLLTGALGRSACVALLFAVHPMNVESVAWVAERKNLLSTALGLMTLQLYALYVLKPGWSRSLPVVAAHALGLMAKSMLVTMPFLLLLLDYWPCRRMGLDRSAGMSKAAAPVSLQPPQEPFVRLVVEKVPLMALSAVSIVLTLLAATEGGALKSLDHFPLGLRLANALHAYALYIGKLFWPVDLAVFYPFAPLQPAETTTAFALICGLTLWVLMEGRRAPYLIVGWFWYLGTLVPVIGLIQVGRQAMADRYVYLPFIGLFILLVWGLARIGRRSAVARAFAAAALLATVLFWAVQTHQQLRHWQSSRALFTHALEVSPANDIAHNNLAHALFQEGDWDGAVAHYEQALRINPSYANAYANLGAVQARQGKTVEAIERYRRALALDPGHAAARRHLELAIEALRTGRGGEMQKRLDRKIH